MIVDSLLIEVGIDASKLSAGARQAISNLRAFEQEAHRRALDVENSAKRAGGAIETVKTQFVELFAALGGAGALIGLAVNINTADAALGRISRSTGISATEIGKWGSVAKIFGGDAQGMAQSFVTMSDAFAGWKVGVVSPLIADFRAISAAGGTIIDVNKGVAQSYLDLSANLHAIAQKDPALAGMLGRRAGIDQGMLDILLKGPEATRQMLELAGALGSATDADVNKAGALAQAWNKAWLAIEGKGRAALNGEAGGLSFSGALTEMLNTFAKDLSTKHEWFGGLKSTSLADYWAALKQPFTGNQAAGGPAVAPASGAFYSQSEKEAFIRAEAAKRGINPDVAMRVARSEGFNQFSGDNGTSFGAFQLHVTPGGRGHAVGDQFKASTGLDPSDPNNEKAAIQFALDDARKNGWGAYHGAARSGIGNFQGIGGGGTVITSTTTVSGPITINVGPNADGRTIAEQFKTTLQRQSMAAQANSGQN